MVTWKTKKAFLYFGGAFIIIFGAALILSAPYPHRWYLLREGVSGTFTMKDSQGFYPELEITLVIVGTNITVVNADLRIRSNSTEISRFVNMTVSSSDSVGPATALRYQKSVTIDLDFGNYTLTAERLTGVSVVELELVQMSDFRLYIVIGGCLNILGLIMGFVGYLISGSILPTVDVPIIDWGFDEEDTDNGTSTSSRISKDD